MKKPNQIRANRNGAKPATQTKPEGKARVRVRMPAQLSRAVRAKAQRQRISVSQLFERAIRKQLPQATIPENWAEVASLDFSGFPGRDCEERIIFKTPQGELKARRSDEGKVTIEDVTREQVVRWIHECTLPEEFAADFSPLDSTLARRDARRKARDVLGNAVHRTAALSEALAALMYMTEKTGEPLMSREANDGMMAVAIKESATLREAFLNLNV